MTKNDKNVNKYFLVCQQKTAHTTFRNFNEFDQLRTVCSGATTLIERRAEATDTPVLPIVIGPQIAAHSCCRKVISRFPC
jgi:hypothetical protein